MTTAEILQRTNGGWDVYEYYYKRSPYYKGNPFVMYRKMPSPFRVDNDPSFAVHPHQTKRGEIWYNDFGDPDRNSVGNCFTYVGYMFGLDMVTDFPKIIKKIEQDVLGVYDGDKDTIGSFVPRSNGMIEKKQVPLLFETVPYKRPWNDFDLLHFAQFFVTDRTFTRSQAKEYAEYWLGKYYMFPVTRYASIIGTNKRIIEASADDPIYVIYFPKTGRSKIYRPFTKDRKNKWRSNIRADEDVFGFHLLPDTCEKMFITAGNKDTIAWSAWLGLPCFPLNSETALLTQPMYQTVSGIADTIYSVMNNDFEHINKRTGQIDNTGLKKELQLKNEFGIMPANKFLKDHGINDVADFIHHCMRNKEYDKLDAAKEYVLSLK